jgi:hypothetical protein
VVLLLVAINVRPILAAIGARRIAAHPERAPQRAASIWYERMTRTLVQRGWRKLPTQTPAEFVRSIEDEILRKSVQTFTARYEQARFAESAEDARQLPELYEKINRGPKSFKT